MTERKRLLIVTPEILPYNTLSDIAENIANLPKNLVPFDLDIRILMPRFGTINERRHKLHEVVRLSGINVAFNDEDYPMMIKVASLPNTRLQVYFLDNEDFYKRKFELTDENGAFYEDNPDRMIFFNRGVIDTVKKFGWAPNYVLCCGWFTSLIPMYLKSLYADDPIFENSKVFYGAFNKSFENALGNDFSKKALLDDTISTKEFEPFKKADHKSLSIGGMTYADAIILGGNNLEKEVTAYAAKSGKPILKNISELEQAAEYNEFFKLVAEEVGAEA